jgi:hypothetical protein
MSVHSTYKFSVTINCDDIAVIGCFRSLSQYSQKSGNNRIPWGGTKNDDWERDGHQVTFRFTIPEYRSKFLLEIERLLPRELWRVIDCNDNNPARPQ